MYICLSLCVCTCIQIITEECVRTLGAEVTGGYEPPDVGAGNQTRVPVRVVRTLNC